MELSGLNKVLCSLHSRKLSLSHESETVQEILINVNIILGKIKDYDHDGIMVFEEVTRKVLRSVSSARYEVYTVVRSLEDMVEVVDSVEEGYTRVELADRGPRPMSFYDWPWYGFLDINGFLEPPALHQHLKKLGGQAIQELHSKNLLSSVQVSEEDMKSGKFRFQITAKHCGNVIIYVIPSVQIGIRPQCLRQDIPREFKNHKVLLTASGKLGQAGQQKDNRDRSLWKISLLTVENEALMNMDDDGGIRWMVRDLVHFLCEKYVHFPVTHTVVDNVLSWCLRANVETNDWLRDKVALRVLEVLENLRKGLRNHRVRNYVIPSFNMLAEVDRIKLDKCAERLQWLLKKLEENPYSLQLFVT